MTNDQLSNAIDSDSKEHSIKEMGKLLLEAMNDWDTTDLTSIEDFSNEFQSFFGQELDISKIKNKPFNPNHSWKFEASSSIIQMLEKSNLNFEESLEKVLKYYDC